MIVLQRIRFGHTIMMVALLGMGVTVGAWAEESQKEVVSFGNSDVEAVNPVDEFTVHEKYKPKPKYIAPRSRSNSARTQRNSLPRTAHPKTAFIVWSGNKRYHRETCPLVMKMTKNKKVIFGPEVIKGRYVPCKECNPSRPSNIPMTRDKHEKEMIEDYEKFVEYNRDGSVKKINFEKKDAKKSSGGKDPFDSFEMKFKNDDKKK